MDCIKFDDLQSDTGLPTPVVVLSLSVIPFSLFGGHVVRRKRQLLDPALNSWSFIREFEYTH